MTALRGDMRLDYREMTAPAAASSGGASTSPGRLGGGLAAGLALVLFLALGLLLGRPGPASGQPASEAGHPDARLGGLQSQIADLERQVQTLQVRQPSCDDGQQALSQARGFLARGKPDIAVSLVEAQLAGQNPPLCAEARIAFADLWYSTSVDLLLALPRPDGRDADGQSAARWQEIERQAGAYGLPPERRVPPMTIAAKAYNAGLWALADAGYRRAWTKGDIGEETACFRYALLRNWGANLAYTGEPAGRDPAVRLLATAQAIADAFHLPQGEACQDLRNLGYADCRQPRPDPTEPLLAAGGR